MSPGSDKKYVPPPDFYGTRLSGIGIWFYFLRLIINELLVVWFSIIDNFLGVFQL